MSEVPAVELERKRTSSQAAEGENGIGEPKKLRSEAEDFRPIVLEVKPWQRLIIPPSTHLRSSDRKNDIHFVVRTSQIEEQPLLYAWPEPDVLEVGLEVRPRFWNPWIKVIAVEDVIVAVCKCYKTEPWTDEISDFTEDDIKFIINGWGTDKYFVLRQSVIEYLMSTEGREKLTKAVEATENSDSRRITMSILDLSQLPVKNWYPVGLELGVKEGTLDDINKQAHEEKECVVRMFDDWLRNHAREACYPPMKLVAVLLDAGEMESARMVCEQYHIGGSDILPTIQDLCLLPLVENEWREVGEQLGVTKIKLAAAKYDESQQGMFSCWLVMKQQDWSCTRASYKELINALYAVGDPELAEQLIRKFKIHGALTKIPVPTKSHSENLMIDWNKFGPHLGFKGKNLGKRGSEIFKEWLKRNPGPTYNKLVSDLSAIGDHEGALTVCKNHGIPLPYDSVLALYGRPPIVRQPHTPKSTSKGGPSKPAGKISKDEMPSLLELLKFPGEKEKFNIPEKIGTNYSVFGIHLLEDKTGAVIDGIVRENRENAKDITMAILKRWLQGKGRQPVTWRILIEVLRDADLTVLANEIETVKCKAS